MLLLGHRSPLSVTGCDMEELPGQHEDECAVPSTYRAEIFAKRGGEEVRLGPHARGSRIRELAEGLIAQASELESEAKEKLKRDETEGAKGGVQRSPVAVTVLGSEAVAVVKVGAHYSHQLSAFGIITSFLRPGRCVAALHSGA